MRRWLIAALMMLLPFAARAQSIGTSSSPTSDNLLQVAGAPISLGQTVRANSLPVTMALDQAPFTQNLVQVGGAPLFLGQQSAAKSLPVVLPWNQLPLAVTLTQIAGQPTANGGVLGSLLVEQGCAGQSVANTSVKPFSLASTTALKIIPLVSNKKVYICSINVVSAAANNVALIEGTKTTNDCDTSTAGLAGGTTAATGWNFAANGGLTLGNGQGLVAKSGSASLDVCLLASGSNQVSGTVVYAQF